MEKPKTSVTAVIWQPFVTLEFDGYIAAMCRKTLVERIDKTSKIYYSRQTKSLQIDVNTDTR